MIWCTMLVASTWNSRLWLMRTSISNSMEHLHTMDFFSVVEEGHDAGVHIYIYMRVPEGENTEFVKMREIVLGGHFCVFLD